MPGAHEVNLDGLVGPTHNYAGLSYGNLASMEHGRAESNPRQAALQGLEKMKLLMELGVRQAVLPPQERPDVEALRRLGFTGNDAAVLFRAHREAPVLLACCASASSMWAANAATVSPAADSADRRPHFTAANLVSHLHRSLEADATATVLRAIFPPEKGFVHHAPLPPNSHLGDEGAANHMRLCAAHGEPGVQVFVYGRSAFASSEELPSRFPARQSLEASAAVARLHRLEPTQTVFLRQNPRAVDEGVFHNDVVAVGNENVLLYHGQAFSDTVTAIGELRQACEAAGIADLRVIEVSATRLGLREAVRTYLFNSQLVTLPTGGMAVVAPAECRENPAARSVLEDVLAGDNPVRSLYYSEVRQSMQNGGGPACLRLRVVLTEEELGAVGGNVLLGPELCSELEGWIRRHYRDHLRPADLADPALLDEGRVALDELSRILRLGSIYRFQRG